ncbi:von Willebrand factor A domain-containing protein 7-like [Seriola dumerili]|uniref:von Willebrand factor A domain-containing protein 7-like n=1 Tax=Seriola dumerili TaxID=41447 RepID=UPI000BBEA032|nr:von Willebrand factor A domain-containing protein 7-like [Seriola dumerili]
MTSVLGMALLGLALMAGPTVAFVPVGDGASTHVNITRKALLQKVKETCRAVAEEARHVFKTTGSSPEELVQACLGPTAKGEVSGAKFHSALQEIYNQNGLVDRDFVNSAPHHFNSEAFLQGRGLITEGMVAIKANIRKENFQAARETLGRVLHTLQDFYSHSNWVELGYTEPYINLIRPDQPLENLADVNTATCRDCASGTCPNSILPNILNEKKLTSGYMGIYSSAKPKGKCSHGGAADLTSTTVPRGGINKDEHRSDNVAFHNAAVNAATTASLQLLEDIRLAAGDNDFLRMMGIARSSVVCFVIDTTGSMSDDIDEARDVVYEIIDSKKGTQDEPSEYILVPFNDPSFGPPIRTTDPNKMKKEISELTAQGGGDTPEMCLSGLQLALTGAPASSHIYVFTDSMQSQSTITFIYNFVESFKGPHPGFAVLSGRPQAGQPATLMLSVMGRKGPSSMSVGNIGLVTVSGPEVVSNGTMTDMGSGDILVTVDMVPEGEFVVILKGTDKVSNSEFQRQSTTQMSVSKVNIQAVVDSSVEPGEAFKLPFSVMTQGSGGQYHISARNDRNFPMSYSSSLTLTTGRYTNDTLNITAPADTPSGTDVTLTVEAKSSSGVDSNYVVLRLSVVTKITDFDQPLCEVVSVQADDCPQDVSQCGPFKWELSANLTDGNGTGIERISLQQGNGSLSYTSLSAPVVQANYNASCCSQIVEIIAVDKVGNVGKCYQSIVRSDGPPALTLSLPLWLCLLVSAFVIRP